MKLVIIDYGAGNIKSIQFALMRLGINAIIAYFRVKNQVFLQMEKLHLRL